MNLYPSLYFAQRQLVKAPSGLSIGDSFASTVSCWLLDTLSVANSGTPSESFSLLLDSGPDADICTEGFQQVVHGRFARAWTWKHGLEAGTITHESNEAIRCLNRNFAFASELGFEEAVMQLVNQSSTILQCNFNPGVPHDHQKTLENMSAKCIEKGYDAFSYFFKYCFHEGVLGQVTLPDDFRYVERMARVYEIQSGDQYLESQERELSYVRTVEEMLKHRKERERQQRAARGYTY